MSLGLSFWPRPKKSENLSTHFSPPIKVNQEILRKIFNKNNPKKPPEQRETEPKYQENLPLGANRSYLLFNWFPDRLNYTENNKSHK